MSHFVNDAKKILTILILDHRLSKFTQLISIDPTLTESDSFKTCDLESLTQGFLICLLICATVEVVSVITGSDPCTYRDQKSVGICGWFYFANSQSAILTMLVPVSLCFVLEKKKFLPFVQRLRKNSPPLPQWNN